MPLARYFLYVGGVLLTLLFILDAYLTEIPFAQGADPNLPVIGIYSDRKWPDRVVFDTSLPTVPQCGLRSWRTASPVPRRALMSP